MQPVTEIRNTYLSLSHPASQPVNGVMIATATTYEGSTHATWSCAADRRKSDGSESRARLLRRREADRLTKGPTVAVPSLDSWICVFLISMGPRDGSR